MMDQPGSFFQISIDGSTLSFQRERSQLEITEFQEAIKAHSERIEMLKHALRTVQTLRDEIALLRELTDEMVALRELRETTIFCKASLP